MFSFYGSPFQAQSAKEQPQNAQPPLPRPKSPPKSFEEWISSQGAQSLLQRPGSSQWPDDSQAQWPVHSTEHGKLIQGDGGKEDLLLGSLDDIRKDLQQHAPWDGVFLDNIDRQLQELEKTLGYLANRFICERDPNSQESAAGGLRNINNITFMTELNEMDLVTARNVHSSKYGSKSKNQDQDQENDIKTLKFPGFGSGAIIQLPGKLEALPILDLVTKAQQFPAYIVRAWRKIFYSDSSTALFQNTFWWIWMDQFKPNPEQQAQLFDTIAESFASNIINMDEKHKDEVFVHYPGCLSQALYCAFCKAFPKFNKYFNSPKFLVYISDLMSEWIAGVKSSPNTWERWPLKVLNPNYSFGSETKPTSRSMRFSERELQLSRTDYSSFNRRQPSGKGRVQSSRGQLVPSSSARGRYIQSAISERGSLAAAVASEEKTSKKESLSDVTIGPGPIFECVQFNTLGRSPLLQHYLFIHGLSEVELVSGATTVSRTQVKEVPPRAITYKELIQRTTDISEEKYRVYDKKMAETGMVINEVHKKYAMDMRKMEKQNKRVLQHRHEVAILAEKLLVANRRKARDVLPPIKKTDSEKTS